MDLFENYDQQPKILSDILNQYNLENMTYKNCKEMLQKVNEIGYTFEYGLDAQPFNLKTKDMKNLSGEYNSTNCFVEQNELENEAVELFGKEWEAESDLIQIMQLIEKATNNSRHYDISVNEFKMEDDIEVKLIKERVELEKLQEQNKALIERLKECFKAMDDSLDWMDELGLNLKESNCYTVLACELAPTDTLLRELKEDDSESSEAVYICKSGSEILRGDKELVKHIRDRNTDDENQCSDEFLINEALNLNEYLVIDEEDVNLMNAIDKVTIDMINNLAHGEDEELNKTYVISKYIEDDVIVIVKIEEWEEVLR